MAKEAGIEGFCYWHYWFGGGKELLERPFNEVVDSGKPDFPFCLGWANHDWSTKTWLTGGKVRNEMIAKQTYPGEDDYILHFNKYLKAFKDPRYIKVDGKLFFLVFAPHDMPDTKAWMDCWQRLAKENGLNGFHFVGITDNFTLMNSEKRTYKTRKQIDGEARTQYDKILSLGYDAVNSRGGTRCNVLSYGFLLYYFKRLLQKLGIRTTVNIRYKKVLKYWFVKEDADENVYPTICPQYDRTPRAGWNTNGMWYDCSPELFKEQVKQAIGLVKNRPNEHKIIILKSWNEWGETNYMEPDLYYGHGFLDALKDALKDNG